MGNGGHRMNKTKKVFHDKYGKTHSSQKDAEFADLCYSMSQKLLDMGLGDRDSIHLLEVLMDKGESGHVARGAFSTFITMTNIYLGRAPGRL